MKIYEKIFDRLDELHMSQMELSRRTGIATSTISDWRKKKINPQADKIVSICRALDMSLVDLLCDEETVEPAAQIDCLTNENYMIELFRQSDAESKRRIISYIELLEVYIKSTMPVSLENGSEMFRSFRILMEIILW